MIKKRGTLVNTQIYTNSISSCPNLQNTRQKRAREIGENIIGIEGPRRETATKTQPITRDVNIPGTTSRYLFLPPINFEIDPSIDKNDAFCFETGFLIVMGHVIPTADGHHPPRIDDPMPGARYVGRQFRQRPSHLARPTPHPLRDLPIGRHCAFGNLGDLVVYPSVFFIDFHGGVRENIRA